MKSSQSYQGYYVTCLFSTMKQLAPKTIRIRSLKSFHHSLMPFSVEHPLEVFPDNPLGLLKCRLRSIPLTFLLCCLPVPSCQEWKNEEL